MNYAGSGTTCIQTPTFLMCAASLFYLTHTIYVWGCMEILPAHYRAGPVKVNYYVTGVWWKYEAWYNHI